MSVYTKIMKKVPKKKLFYSKKKREKENHGWQALFMKFDWKFVLFYLRFNNIKVIAIVALANDIIAWLNLSLEHRIQDLVHLQKQIGYKGHEDGEGRWKGIILAHAMPKSKPQAVCVPACDSACLGIYDLCSGIDCHEPAPFRGIGREGRSSPIRQVGPAGHLSWGIRQWHHHRHRLPPGRRPPRRLICGEKWP